jgi:hypothetical protein
MLDRLEPGALVGNGRGLVVRLGHRVGRALEESGRLGRRRIAFPDGRLFRRRW